jgi:hypothetical protein
MLVYFYFVCCLHTKYDYNFSKYLLCIIDYTFMQKSSLALKVMKNVYANDKLQTYLVVGRLSFNNQKAIQT